jgi:DNA-binding NtrC family response regulator
MSDSILLVGRDIGALRLVAADLRERGFRIALAGDAAKAQRELVAQAPDLILLDHPWPLDLGQTLIEQWAGEHAVLVLCAEAGIEAGLQAMRFGATEFLIKPLDQEELAASIRRVIDNSLLYRQGDFYTSVLRHEAPSLLVGESEPLQRLLRVIKAVAPSEATVLILGESGVGKEKVAQEIHRLSPRAQGPLVAVDCCSLPETLFETELFGHERGAFTGASHRKTGLVEQAGGGTLFLDEIGEISPTIQAKLLRVLETRSFRRLGGTAELQADVRIIAATNRDLEAMARRREFRQDLFFRLNAFAVQVPPLRDRRGDVPPLVRHFLTNSGFSRRVVKRVSAAAMQQLLEYDWPGNVRELRNVIERAIILSGNRLKIEPEHLNLSRRPPPPTPGLPDGAAGVTLTFAHEPTLAEIEQRYVQLLLDRHRGSRAELARVLGIGERTLYRLLANLKAEPVRLQ